DQQADPSRRKRRPRRPGWPPLPHRIQQERRLLRRARRVPPTCQRPAVMHFLPSLPRGSPRARCSALDIRAPASADRMLRVCPSLRGVLVVPVTALNLPQTMEWRRSTWGRSRATRGKSRCFFSGV
ncbi:hypothetical protein LTR28_003228, partial [Elasticomyces elasticus]